MTVKTYGQILLERRQKSREEKEAKVKEEERKLKERLEKTRNDRIDICARIQRSLLNHIDDENRDPEFIAYYLSKRDDIGWILDVSKDEQKNVRDKDVWNNFIFRMSRLHDIDVVIERCLRCSFESQLVARAQPTEKLEEELYE